MVGYIIISSKSSSKWIPSTTLQHHGIKGQKWGVVNGPPYPLDDNDKSASEKRKGLSDKQKKIIKVSAITVASLVAAYGCYKLYKSGELDKFIETGKKYVNNHKNVDYGNDIMDVKFNEYFGKNQDLSIDITARRVNPNLLQLYDNNADKHGFIIMSDVNPKQPKALMNCQACSLAYELRRRGFDAISRPVDTSYSAEEFVNKVYKNAKFKRKNFSDWKVLESELIKQGEGARGVLSIRRQSNNSLTGHSLMYEVTGNGLTIIDSQLGKVTDKIAVFEKYYNASLKEVGYARTDNLSFNDLDFIKEFVSGVDRR